MEYKSKTYYMNKQENKLSELAGTKIRLARQKKGLSQENMAQVLGITQPAYSHIERNAGSLTIERLQKIAQYLEVSIAELLSEGSTNNADFMCNRSITIHQYPKGLVERNRKNRSKTGKTENYLNY